MPASNFAAIPVALGAVMALIWAAQFAVRRGWFRLPIPIAPVGHAIALVQTLNLDAKRRVQLLRVRDREVLLLTGGERDVVIGWLEAHRDPAPGPTS